MRGLTGLSLITVITFVAQAHAKDAMDAIMDKLVDKLLDRALTAGSIDHTEVDDTTLGKPAYHQTPQRALPQSRGTFAASHLPQSPGTFAAPHLATQFPLKARLRPLSSTTVHSLSHNSMDHLESFNKKPSTPHVGKAVRATSSGVVEAEAGAAAAAAALEKSFEKPATSKPGEVNDVYSEEELDDFLSKSSEPVVLEVTMNMCRACKLYAPKYRKLATEYSGKAQFLKMVGNANPSTRKVMSKRLEAKVTPSFYVIVDGKIVDRFAGGRDEPKLRATLDRLAGSEPTDTKQPADSEKEIAALERAAKAEADGKVLEQKLKALNAAKEAAANDMLAAKTGDAFADAMKAHGDAEKAELAMKAKYEENASKHDAQ